MGVPKPLLKDQAEASVKEIYEGMHSAIGKMPNIFAVMAHFPAASETVSAVLHGRHDERLGSSEIQGTRLSKNRQHQRLPILTACPRCFGEAGGH